MNFQDLSLDKLLKSGIPLFKQQTVILLQHYCVDSVCMLHVRVDLFVLNLWQ